MKGKITSMVTVSLLVLIGIFSAVPLVKSEDDPTFTADNNGPWTGWYNEDVTFSGSCSGGTPPYSYEWHFGDTTSSTSNPEDHEYTPTTSPTSYYVRMDVEDSSDPPQSCWIGRYASISIQYDIKAIYVNPDNHLYSSGQTVTLSVRAGNDNSYHICPDFTAQVKIKTLLGATVKTFPIHDGDNNLDPGDNDDWTEQWQTAPSGTYKAWLYVTPDDSYDENSGNHVEDSFIFTVI